METHLIINHLALFFLTLFLGTDRVTRKAKYSENIKGNSQKNKRRGVERRNVQCGVPAEPEYDLASQQHTCPMKTWGISRALVPWIPNPSIFSSRNRLRIINIGKLGKLQVTHARACVRVRERKRESYERGLWRQRELRRGLGLWRLLSACNLRFGRPCDWSVS